MSPGLGIGTTLACFQSSGNVPVLTERLNNFARLETMLTAVSFNILAEIPSTPLDFVTSRFMMSSYSKPVADLIHHISSCSYDPSVDQLDVQLVAPHQLSTSVPQLLWAEIVAVNISCALPSDPLSLPSV